MNDTLGRAGAEHRLCDLGNLVTSPDYWVALFVLDDVDLLVLLLGTLPDLNLASTTDNTYPHGGEQVVGGVGVEVDTTVEHGSSVFADTALDQGLATGVLVDEVGDVVNNTGDSDQTAAVLSLLNVVVPLDDGKLLKRYTPVELGALLVNLLL
jgi:hypothetical protein